MAKPIGFYRLLISDYFDRLRSEIDMATEKELQKIPLNDPKAAKINHRRELFLHEIKDAERYNLKHLNNELAKDIEQLGELDEHFLMEKLFKVYCFAIDFDRSSHLIITDLYLSREQLALYKLLVAQFNRIVKININLNGRILDKFFDMVKNVDSNPQVWISFAFFDCRKFSQEQVIRAKSIDIFKILEIRLYDFFSRGIKEQAEFLFRDIKYLVISADCQIEKLNEIVHQVNLFEDVQRKIDPSTRKRNITTCIDLKVHFCKRQPLVDCYRSVFENNTIEIGELLDPFKELKIQSIDIETDLRLDYPLFFKFNNDFLNNMRLKKHRKHSILNRLHLIIVDLQIERIDSHAFHHFKHLTDLRLNGLGLASVDTHAFAGLRKLESLDLSMNKLERVEDETFGHLDNLRTLSLYENKIKRLQPRLFVKLSRLLSLSLSRNPIDEVFHEDTFSGLDKLEELELKKVPVAGSIDAKSKTFTEHLKSLQIIFKD
jgi:hypothetical protein